MASNNGRKAPGHAPQSPHASTSKPLKSVSAAKLTKSAKPKVAPNLKPKVRRAVTQTAAPVVAPMPVQVAASPLIHLAPDAAQSTPLYLQLVRNLTAAIEGGQWRAGEALPPERVLCEQLGVSRVTMRMALDALVKHGLVTRRQGAGTFVRPSIEHALSGLSSFSEVLQRKGYKPGTRWLERSLRAAHGDEMLSLGLSPDSMVASLTRLRSADGKIMAYEQAVIPARLLPNPKLVGESLYAYLDGQGSPVVRALQHFRAVNLNARMAKYLDMKEGEAILRVVRVGYARDGGAIELTDTYCHSDYYDFVAELRR